MIDIITRSNKGLLETKYKHLQYVEYPWKLFDEVSSLMYKSGESGELERVIADVEGCGTLPEQNMFLSKFNGMPLRLSSLSTGSQVVLCIYYLAKRNAVSDKVIDITDCGGNAIEYMLKNYNDFDLTMYLGHTELSSNEELTFKVNGEVKKGVYSIMEAEHAGD